MNCPFCDEADFDKIGLKGHLTAGDCEAWNHTVAPLRLFGPAIVQPAAGPWRTDVENAEPGKHYAMDIHGIGLIVSTGDTIHDNPGSIHAFAELNPYKEESPCAE